MTLKEKLNLYGLEKEPFFFCVSYDMTQWEVVKLSELPANINFEIDNIQTKLNSVFLKKEPISKEKYKIKFDNIQQQIRDGNSYLINLTSKTKIGTDYSLRQLYDISNARFKLYFKDKFICFSPERFVNISDNTICTYPMKGTIDASIPNAKEKILNDKKELAEHTMVVDLLRNDLSIVATDVKVGKFRYCETIDAGDKQLIQVSSKIQGSLENDWHKNIGDIITSILPAGSITGTPKKKTVEIIKIVEGYDRDFFTGIFGVFDGKCLDSSIMIRFIEKSSDGLIYKSGGGITCDSSIEAEYQETIDKVYIP